MYTTIDLINIIIFFFFLSKIQNPLEKNIYFYTNKSCFISIYGHSQEFMAVSVIYEGWDLSL